MTQLDLAERTALRELVREIGARHASSSAVRSVLASGGAPNPSLDADLAAAGLRGLEIPDKYGGSGAGYGELGIVLEELGAYAAPSRLLGSAVLCAGAILLGGSVEHRERWLPGLADGSCNGTVALAEWCDSGSVPVVAERSATGWTLRGSAGYVPDACSSDLVVVAAASADGPVLAAVAPPTDGVELAATEMTDMTRQLDHITFADVAVSNDDVILHGDPADAVINALLDRAAVAVTADSIGNARRVLDMTVTYAGQREQFGRPIGSFQAVKHHMANMLVNVETASALFNHALAEVAASSAGAPAAASMAKEHACARVARNAGIALQIHGGIGYTWEHDLHIYFKRAKLNEFLFGDARWHRRRIITSLIG